MSDFPLTNSLPPQSGSATASTTAAESLLEKSPTGRKLLKATREFEADLITSWWQEAEKDIQDSGGGEFGSGLDGLKNVAMNRLASSMVKAGGLGIARMIFHSIEPALRRKLAQETGAGGTSGATQMADGKEDNQVKAFKGPADSVK